MLQVFDPTIVRGLLQERCVDELARQIDTETVRIRGWLNGRRQSTLAILDRLAPTLRMDPFLSTTVVVSEI